MKNNKVTYKHVFNQAVSKGELNTVKKLLNKFGLPFNEAATHNLAISLINGQCSDESCKYNHHLINAMKKMQIAQTN